LYCNVSRRSGRGELLRRSCLVSSSNAWTDSFQNIKCYDSLKVQAIINEIDGLDHTGTARTHVPNVFGMNFQAVSVGEKLVESSISTTGGYNDALGTPSEALADEIKFVDNAIGSMVTELKTRRLFDTTTIIITAKHGQSPIDPKRVLRIPADNPSKQPPSQVLAAVDAPVQALEDDVSLLWLSNRTPAGISSALAALEANAGKIGANGGEFYVGPSLGLMYNVSSTDSRTPDIIVAPNVGVIYTGGMKKIAEHGGFAHDDTNVMMLVSNPKYAPRSINAMVQTAQVPPTILRILGLDPHALIAVKNEGTAVLPGF
jgi:Type I phosphodiesterase / nucleotide pyrophosphatase